MTFFSENEYFKCIWNIIIQKQIIYTYFTYNIYKFVTIFYFILQGPTVSFPTHSLSVVNSFKKSFHIPGTCGIFSFLLLLIITACSRNLKGWEILELSSPQKNFHRKPYENVDNILESSFFISNPIWEVQQHKYCA